MDLGVSGDVALVTASSSGLGHASAESLAAEGAHVVICGRDEERLDEAAEELDAVGDGEVLAVPTDLTDRDDIAALVEATVEEFGQLDHLVTSAGGPPSGSFDDMSSEDWYGAYDLLVMSAVWTVKEAEPHLKESDAGTITCITSTSVREVIDDLILSNSVRRGVIGLVKSLSREFAPDVRVNAVLPGAHETSRVEELVEDAVERGDVDSYEEGLEGWSNGIPMGRIGKPEELGDTVAFLASDCASFVNGVALPVDGGKMRS
ncbi:SDR family oxidoreductase [Haloprofundus halophilus]|uniref:SDR family oxidoreductase n=1 Tax=Haloprofundus halophilus TaxID=2283527 RepID=UPI000E430D17|nr:SDR family oxidoreductase [Haloprofundus halophilus]